MGRTFRPLEPLRGWRRLAAHAWRPPRDPSVYALLEIPMRSALAHVERLREESGLRVTVTHLVTRAVALAIRRYPQLNGIVARGRIMLRETVDIFIQVPVRLLGPVVRILSYLTYDLDLDLTRFDVVKDGFGSAMVTNVGTFGLAQAYAPLVPFSRVPLVVLVGEVQDKAVVEAGRVVVRPMMTLGVTFDHRFMDGYHGGAMAQLVRAFLEDPARFDAPRVEALSAAPSLRS